MVDLEQLHLIAQLVDSLDKTILKLEQAYNNNNGEDFKKAKENILDFQQKIAKELGAK